MTQAVLFDNDDVLVDTEILFFETTRAAFAQLGLELTREAWSSRYLAGGKSSREIASALGADPSRLDAVIEQRNQEYRRVLRRHHPVRPEVRATLAALHGRVKLGIVTGCGRHQLDLVHRTTELLRYFDVIVTSDDCACTKPDPEPYLNALRVLGASAERCLAVEDSPKGLASARAAGVPCIVVPSELTRCLEFPGALAIEQDPTGILKHVKFRQLGA